MGAVSLLSLPRWHAQMTKNGSRSSDYVRPGTGHAMDAKERLPVMGVLVTRVPVISLLSSSPGRLTGFLRRFPPTLASELC
jgi:hypothetical protein